MSILLLLAYHHEENEPHLNKEHDLGHGHRIIYGNVIFRS